MEYILTIISTIIIGLITNYIYDKIKNHPNRHSSDVFELDVKIKFKCRK